MVIENLKDCPFVLLDDGRFVIPSRISPLLDIDIPGKRAMPNYFRGLKKFLNTFAPEPESKKPDFSPIISTNCKLDCKLTSIEKYLFQPHLSDISFLVQNEKIYAHKFILSANCDYFEKLFFSNMKEKSMDEIPYPNINIVPFKHLLRYIYTGSIDSTVLQPNEQNFEIVLELLHLSDMFILPNLKQNLEVFLCNSKICKIGNILNLISHAESSNASQLFEKCQIEINFHWDIISETELKTAQISKDLKQKILDNRRKIIEERYKKVFK